MSHSRIWIIPAASLLLLACGTPREVAKTAIPPPEIQRDLPLEQPPPALGRICKLGESCLTLDSRPFEACLVDTKHCVDKAVESMPAASPRVDEPPPRPIKARE